MSKAFRRVILKPPGCPPEECAKLAERLRAAVEWQQQLTAGSPHVLHFIGTIQETDAAFVVEHEPAELLLTVSELFDGSPPVIDDDNLLRFTVSIFDALRAAHIAQSRGFLAHGGMSPGVIVRTEDGVVKVSDFGFASAVHAAAGQESYLNLAVGPPPDAGPVADCSAVWEVLSPDEFDREDRICAFVDPEKYGSGAHGTFEPSSDILAAGFLAHLVAEHSHPYLSEPDSHRMVDLSEFMSALKYSGARRKDLRESSNEGIRTWCELIRKSIARVPQERPNATEIVSKFAPFAKPVDQWDTLRGRLDQQRSEKSWTELRSLAKGISENTDAPQELRDFATDCHRLANAHMLLNQAVDLMKGKDWRKAESAVQQLTALPALPPEVAERAKKVEGVLNHNLQTESSFARLKDEAAHVDDADIENAQPKVQQLLEDASRLIQGDSILPELRDEMQPWVQQLEERNAKLTSDLEEHRQSIREEKARLEKERQADRETADAWLGEMQDAMKAEEWVLLAEMLGAPPKLKHWPDDAEIRAAEFSKALKDHRAKEALKAEMEEDRRKAEAWLDQLKSAADQEDWAKVARIVAKKPELRHWPSEVVQQAAAIEADARAHIQREKDHKAATAWIGKLEKELKGGRPADAKKILAQRPRLEFFPEEIAARAGEIESQLLELEERVSAWLASVHESSDKRLWDDALRTLDAPPLEFAKLAGPVRQEAEQLREQCTAGKQEQIRAQQEERSRQVKAAASQFISELVDSRLTEFIAPHSVVANATDEEFDDPVQLSSGSARLSVAIRDDHGARAEPITEPFEFQPNGDTLLVRNKDKLERQVSDKLSEQIGELQRARMATLVKPWRGTLFPNTQVSVKLGKLEGNVPVSIFLLGKEAEHGQVKTDLVWDKDSLTWRLANEKEFVHSAIATAIEEARKVATKTLFEQTDAFKKYRKNLALTVVQNSSTDSSSIPDSLRCAAQLAVRSAGKKEPETVHTFKFSCPTVGKLADDFDAGGAVAALERFVVGRQSETSKQVGDLFAKRLGEKNLPTKVSPTPSRITSPVDEVKLKVVAKRRKPVEVTIGWDTEKMTFLPPASWETMCDQIAESEEVGGGNRAFIAVGGAGAVVVLAAVVYLLTGSPDPIPTPNAANANTTSLTSRNDNINATQVANANVSPVPDPNLEAANAWCGQYRAAAGNCEALAAVLATRPSGFRWPRDADCTGSEYDGFVASNCGEDKTPPEVVLTALQAPFDDLTDVVGPMDLATLKQGVAVFNGTVRVPIPGLSGQPLSIPTTVADSAARASEVRAKVDELRSLLSPDRLQEEIAGHVRDVIANQYSGFVDSSEITFSVQNEGAWTLLADGSGWRRSGIALKVVHPKANTPASIPFKATAVDGRLDHRLGAADDSIEGMAGVWLRSLQRDALTAVAEEIRTAVAPAELVSPSARDLASTVEFQVTHPRLLDRKLPAAWNSAALTFKPEDAAINEARLAIGVIEELQSRAAANTSNWLHQDIPVPDWQERAQPAEGRWLMDVAAPWNENERLPIAMEWPPNLDPDPQQIVNRLLSSAPPAFWSIVQDYLSLRDSGVFPAPQGMVSGDLGRLSLTFSVAAGAVTASYSEQDSLLTGLRVPVVGRWAVAADLLPSGLDAGKIQSAIDALAGADDERVLTLAQGAEPALSGEQFDPPVQLAALDARLDAHAQRAEAESSLEKLLLVGTSSADLSEDVSDSMRDLSADAALEAIWQGKDASINVAGFRQVLANARKFDRIKRGEKEQAISLLYPTILVEYFCGPNNCYSFATAAGKGTADDVPVLAGPFVQRLCPTSRVINSGPDEDLGPVLLEPVLANIPNTVRSAEDTQNVLGIAVALDDILDPERLVHWSIGAPQDSFIDELDEFSTKLPTKLTWNNLESLHFPEDKPEAKWSCDYWLLDTLANLQSSPPAQGMDESQRWARGVIAAASGD